MHKRCSDCKTDKPYAAFGRNKSQRDGYSHVCKDCRKQRSRTHYEAKREAILAKNAKWRIDNRDRANEITRRAKKKARAKKLEEPRICPSCSQQFPVEPRKHNRECPACRRAKRLNGYRNYYRANRETVLDWNKRYAMQQETIERRKAYNIAYRLEKSEFLSESRKKRYKLIKDCQAFQDRAAAARVTVRAERGTTSLDHIRHLYAWQEGCCYYCSRPVAKEDREFDHIVPVSLAGTANPYNVVLACKSCNQSKRDLILGLEWTPTCQNPGHIIESTLQKSAPDNVLILSSFWASERYSENARDIMPSIAANEPRIIVFDYEWLAHQDAIINMAHAKAGDHDSIGARSLKAGPIDYRIAADFLDKWHLQGSIHATVYIGLYSIDTLHGVASFVFRHDQWELSRLAFMGHVTGGFGKLLSYFRKNYQDSYPILSYVDPRHGNGNSYRTLGFEEREPTKTPMYWYTTPSGIAHRLKGSIQAMKDADIFLPDIGEDLLNQMNGRYRLFGRRQLRFILRP